jgi:hypothetical protein
VTCLLHFLQNLQTSAFIPVETVSFAKVVKTLSIHFPFVLEQLGLCIVQNPEKVLRVLATELVHHIILYRLLQTTQNLPCKVWLLKLSLRAAFCPNMMIFHCWLTLRSIFFGITQDLYFLDNLKVSKQKVKFIRLLGLIHYLNHALFDVFPFKVRIKQVRKDAVVCKPSFDMLG